MQDQRLALDAAGFSCAVEHPHKLLLGLSHVLSSNSSSTRDSDADADSSSPSLTEEAWALANDSLRTPLCVRFGPEVVAAGCLFLASRRLGVALPEGEGEEKEGKKKSGGGGGGGGSEAEKEEKKERRFLVGTLVEPPRRLDAPTSSRWPASSMRCWSPSPRGTRTPPSGSARRGKERKEREEGKREQRRGERRRRRRRQQLPVLPARLPPPSKLGSAAASAVAKARAAAARAAAARKRPGQGGEK